MNKVSDLSLAFLSDKEKLTEGTDEWEGKETAAIPHSSDKMESSRDPWAPHTWTNKNHREGGKSTYFKLINFQLHKTGINE